MFLLFQEGIALAKAEIDAIVNNPDAPTFENTVVAMDFSGDILDRLSSIFFNLNSAETNDEMQKIAQKFRLYYLNLEMTLR
jgi:peptidyl-dipeptidase Dcp